MPLVSSGGIFILSAIRNMGKKRQQPPKGLNLCLRVLRVPSPNGPNSFSSGCGVPQRTHNARTCAFTPRGQGTKPEMTPVSSARAFILTALGSVGKKSQRPPKGSNLWPLVLRVHGPNGPKCFSSGCCFP